MNQERYDPREICNDCIHKHVCKYQEKIIDFYEQNVREESMIIGTSKLRLVIQCGYYEQQDKN